MWGFFMNTIRGRDGKVWYVLLLCAALTMLLTACGGQSQPQTTQSAQVPTLPLPPIGGMPPAASSLQALGQLPPDITLQLSIGLATNRQALANDLAAIYNPGSPQFGHYLTPAELASRYGAAQASIDNVKAFLQAQGFQIISVSSLRNQISVSASVAQITQTFGITLQTFNENGVTVFGPSGTIILPSALKGLITSVIGLSSIAQPNHHALPLTAPVSSAPEQPADECDGAQAHGVTPNQTAVAYGYTQAYKAGLTGKGISIGVYESNDQAFAVNDVNTFLRCTTGSTLHRSVIKVDSGSKENDLGSIAEAEGDMEYLAALAPDAQLLEYQNDICLDPVSCVAGQGLPLAEAFADATNQMAADGRIQVASISLAEAEEYFAQDEIFSMDQAIDNLAAEGVTVAIATGDCGAFGDNQYGHLSVDLPASAPYALAVGGTELQTDSQGNRSSEIVWSNPNPDKSQQCQNDWGSTGGLSQVFPQVSWQQGNGVKNKYANGKRQLPDVSAIAWKEPLYFQSQWHNSGGTSIATPIWAAGLALVDQGLMQHHKQLVGATPTFYRVANQQSKLHPYYDITQGTNEYYPATVGFDLATGWGAPNLPDFGKALGVF
jgi:kumamolisin